MVCMDPIGCGRNVSKMLKVAKAYEGKGNIVMTTGFQKGSNYCPNTSFLATVDTNIVAKYMIAEVAEGMDLNSYNGPYVERTIAKAGVIKAGTSYRIITKLEQKALAVAAITQKETGCPISIHTDFGTMGSEILDEIEDVLQYFYMFDIHQIPEDALRFATLIRKSCKAVDAAMEDFRNFKKSKNFKQLVIQVSDNEEEADALYVEVIRNLHVNHADEPMHVLKWSRLYAFMESCCDACEHTADLMSTILLKNM